MAGTNLASVSMGSEHLVVCNASMSPAGRQGSAIIPIVQLEKLRHEFCPAGRGQSPGLLAL